MVARVVSPRCFSMYSWKGAIWPCTEERARGSLSSGNQASTCAALRSRPRARAIWETLSPACQCRKSSTTSTTANILLAIRAPSIELPMGGTLRVRTWRLGVGNCLTLGVGNYLIPPLGNCLTLQGLSLGNYLIADIWALRVPLISGSPD